MIQQEQSQSSSSSQKIIQLPKRPKRSGDLRQIGRPIDLVSNHFKLTFVNAREKIIVYSIKIEPSIAQDARKLKDDIMKSAQQQIEAAGLKPHSVKGLNIWSPIKVEAPITVDTMLVETNTQYAIKIAFVKEYSHEDFSGQMDDSKQRNPLVQSINIGVKDSLKKLRYVEIGRNSKYYDPRAMNDNRIQGAGIKVWRGFKTALHIFNQQPYLLIDFSSRVLREQTALDFIDQLYDKFKNKKDVIAEMQSLSVIANYGNYRIYRVDDIDFESTPKSKFMLEDKREITYVQYFQERYNIKIKIMDQPLIVYRDKRNPDKKTCLIPELLNMTGLTNQQRADWRLMKDVAEFTKLTPEARNREILTLQGQLTAPLREKNIILDQDQRMTGFQLDPPKIRLGGGKQLQNDVGFFILKDAVLKPGHIKDWFLIYLSKGKRDDQDADYLVDELKKNASKLGIKLEDPYFVVARDENPSNWVYELENEFKKGGRPQMIVSFMPEKSKDRLYPALKELCLVKEGIQHQNVLVKFLRNKNPGAVASKIVQQMNVKLGMPIWSIPRPQQVSEKTMLIGIDIYHKLVSGNRSCMGLVASLDSEFTQYFSRIILMKKGQEMSTEIAGVIEQAVKAYFANNDKRYLPDTIIIYRDGVGEGQVQTLIQTELSQIQSAFGRVSPNYAPKCAMIMINKKINHRFFATGGGDQGSRPQSRGAKGGPRSQLVNPPTGTIVADKVVTPNFDFFLCAQYVTEGTCTPTHFIVLHNNTDWTEETFWMLTYYQCFNYLNWSGAVRVPACVQYAHKLAYLVGDTFQKQVHSNLERYLCFL